ncbi:MAG TPA: FAD-binding protein [Thermodesulfobacteriota bacterium]|nr:FAD-binding protein [Thermodesulfobacteriota bacterium]
MATERVVETDVLVIGGGLGGMFAAIKARESRVGVTVVEKAYAGKSGGAAMGASWLAVFHPGWGHDFDTWMNFITGIGEFLNHREWIEIIVKESYARYRDLVAWGIPFASEKGRSPAPGSHAMPLVKNSFMPILREKVLESGARILDRIMVTDLLKQDGRVSGAVGFDTRNRDFYTFKAKATVVATGSGAFKVPGWTDAYWTADGDAMSYRAGGEIVGKEFGGKDGGTLKDFSSARIGVIGGYNRFVNAEGNPFISTYARKYETESHRMISSLFEVHAGRGPIFVDFESATPEERQRAAKAIEANGLNWLAERVGFDVNKAGKVEIEFGSWVGNQPSQGGVLINTKCESVLPGLYAAGDCAGTRMCGSCYAPMGYGLAGASVTGHRAGQHAAEFALKVKDAKIDEKEISGLREGIYDPLLRSGGFSPGFLAQTLQNIMVPYYIMQIKHGQRLQAALTMVEFLGGHLVPKMKARDGHDLRMVHEARNMILNAEMVLRASLFRTESRGSHYREDFPHRVDPDWLAWTVLKQEQGEMKAFKLPIPIEWWPDLSKPFEERYELRFPAGASQVE